jgi:hypothetical protein
VRRWLIVRWRVLAARVDDPLAFGAGLLAVGLVAGLGAGARLVVPAPVEAGARSGAAVRGGLPFGAKMPDAGGAVRAAVGFVRVWARVRSVDPVRSGGGWHESDEP